MNKKIAIEVALGVIIIVAIIVGGTVWFSGNQNAPVTPRIIIDTKSVPANTTTDETDNWRTYSNSKYKFQLKYPSEWIDQGRLLEDINFFKKSVDDDTLGVLQIELEKKYKDFDSLESIASQLIVENNCIAYGEKSSPDHIIKKSESGVMLVLFCSAGSEYYEYLFRNENNDLIKISYHDDFDFNLAEAQKIEKFEKIISTIRLTGNDETAGWQTYRNEKYGFEFKYPSVLIIEEGVRAPWKRDDVLLTCSDKSNCSGYVVIRVVDFDGENITTLEGVSYSLKSNNSPTPMGQVDIKEYITNGITIHSNEFNAMGISGREVAITKKNKAYLFQFSNDLNQNNYPDKILSTFKFIN